MGINLQDIVWLLFCMSMVILLGSVIFLRNLPEKNKNTTQDYEFLAAELAYQAANFIAIVAGVGTVASLLLLLIITITTT